MNTSCNTPLKCNLYLTNIIYRRYFKAFSLRVSTHLNDLKLLLQLAYRYGKVSKQSLFSLILNSLIPVTFMVTNYGNNPIKLGQDWSSKIKPVQSTSLNLRLHMHMCSQNETLLCCKEGILCNFSQEALI